MFWNFFILLRVDLELRDLLHVYFSRYLEVHSSERGEFIEVKAADSIWFVIFHDDWSLRTQVSSSVWNVNSLQSYM
jgi:hypothetical protein